MAGDPGMGGDPLRLPGRGGGLVLLVGCGSGESRSSDTTAATTGAGGAATTSKYDSGPRAGETPIDASRADAGEEVFQAKGCTACHGWGQRMSGPDLKGVTMRRTAQWMEQQILHPEVMTKEDPIAHALMAEYSLQMSNQGLTPDEARAVIEYLKHRDHEDQEDSDDEGRDQ